MGTAQTESQIHFPDIFACLLQAVLSGFSPLLANAKCTCQCMCFTPRGPQQERASTREGRPRLSCETA